MSDEPSSKKKFDIVSSKEKTAKTRAARGKGIKREEVLGTGPENYHGMPKLPPGQHEVKDWPVLDLGIHPEVSPDQWQLEIFGLVKKARVLTWKDLMSLPQVEDVSDFHCVTTWSRFDNKWRGVRLSDLLVNEIGILPDAGYVFFSAYDGYTTNLPLSEALKPDVLLVHTFDGKPLPREHGGPCRVITPQLYAWKGAKWVNKIEVIADDRLGFWELRGYSNTALPWQDDRYAPKIIQE